MRYFTCRSRGYWSVISARCRCSLLTAAAQFLVYLLDFHNEIILEYSQILL